MSDEPHRRRKANLARYFSADPKTREALVRALSRLPDDALEFAIAKCAFFSCGGGLNGQCLPSRFITEFGADWIVLIYDNAPDIETVIAHEVAHAFLRHSVADPLMSDDENERPARELVRAWGFSGKGADY